MSDKDRRRLTSALQNMRMSCNSTYLLDQETDHGIKADELAALFDKLFAEPEAKAVVFSQWTRTHDIIIRRLEARGLGYVSFHGGVPSEKRPALVERFRDDPACRGGSRLNRFMKEVENVTGRMGESDAVSPAEEVANMVTTDDAAAAGDVSADAGGAVETVTAPIDNTQKPPGEAGSDPWHALAQVGMQFIAALAAANDRKPQRIHGSSVIQPQVCRA